MVIRVTSRRNRVLMKFKPSLCSPLAGRRHQIGGSMVTDPNRKIRTILAIVGAATSIFIARAALGDVQITAPGTGDQGATVVNTGPNGICETTANSLDIQFTDVGQYAPYQPEIRCGPNKIVDSIAAGDDVQRKAPGDNCGSATTVVIDVGPNGIADTANAGDDTRVIALSGHAINAPCVITGTNGLPDTTTASGDDAVVLTGAAPNTPVVTCGPDLVANTTANNTGFGDDVQVRTVSSICTSEDDVVVDSGADGVSSTLAEGSDLVVGKLNPLKLTIGRGKSSVAKTVSVSVSNVEFGDSAPVSRPYKLVVKTKGCPGGSITNVDSDASSPTVDTSANILKGRTIKGSFTVTIRLDQITTTNPRSPFRCEVVVTAQLAGVGDPFPDDAANSDNNSVTMPIDVFDGNG
jgi:hypothetical protein